MAKRWTSERISKLVDGYKVAAVMTAAGDLDLFAQLVDQPADAATLAGRLDCEPRALGILLDALAAIGLLKKKKQHYRLAKGVEQSMTAKGESSILAMVQHHGNCLRRWSQLARVVKNGRAATGYESIRGREGDSASFIEAMDNICKPFADEVAGRLKKLTFNHLLDVGGASGTWTLAFLKQRPQLQATLFDLPHVIPMAQKRIEQAGCIDRVKLVAGDYYSDELPEGVDLVWLSAITHQNSREQNHDLYAKIFRALTVGGRVVIRDVIMDKSHTQPRGGALFAVNMLVGTEAGGTFSFKEYQDDLASVGFTQIEKLCDDDFMNGLIVAVKE